MKTAVEWLKNQFQYTDKKLFDQALEMEKQQIIDAHIHGHNASSSTLKNFDAEQYYLETYKNETE